MYKLGLGQDSHRFLPPTDKKPLRLGGVLIEGAPGMDANSDGDVILHALTNAVSSVTGKPILGFAADELCKNGITDSRAYLQIALDDLQAVSLKLTHVSISLEMLRPKMKPHLESVREKVAELLRLEKTSVGLTVHSGEGLTDCGKGLGIYATVIITCQA